MKKLLFSLILLLFMTSLSAQYQKVRVGILKKWYVGTFEEVRGNYSIAIDTISDNYDVYEEEDEGFWSEQYEYHYTEIYDSVRITIRRYSILYNNELFDNVYTIKVKPKYHYYNMAARNENDRTIILIMYPEDQGRWQIFISETGGDGWEGVWERRGL